MNPIELIDSIVDCENRTRRAISIILALTTAIAVILLATALLAVTIGVGRASSFWVIPTAFSGLVCATTAKIRHSRRGKPGRRQAPDDVTA